MTVSEKFVTRKENLDLYYGELSEPKFNHNENLSFEGILCKNFEFINLNKTLKFTTANNIIAMQFCFSGTCNYKNEIDKKEVSFKNAEYNVFFIPKGSHVAKIRSKKSTFFNIYIEEAFFFRQIPSNHAAFMSRRADKFESLLNKNYPITPNIQYILNEISACKFDGHLKMLFIKAKVMEMITLQLAQQESERTLSLDSNQIEKMALVKNLIDNNLNKTYSLANLARIAGTNEQYLKQHFKILYGETVFGYMLALKMLKAKELLLKDKHRIAEVAEIVGYKHATHFTTAFKKFFGYLPKALKTKFLLGSYLSSYIELEFLELLIAI